MMSQIWQEDTFLKNATNYEKKYLRIFDRVPICFVQFRPLTAVEVE